MRAVSVVVAAGMFMAGNAAQAASCSYRIDNPGHASVNSFSERIDGRTTEHTTTTRIGRGAHGAGVLILNTDGTYEIRGYAGLGSARKGRWIENDEGPFSDKGGIELLDVKGSDYGADQRAWYVYTNDEGALVGREPPYTAYNDLRLTSLGGGPCAPGGATAAAADRNGPTTAKQAAEPRPAAEAVKPAPAQAAAGQGRTWTHQGFREHFMGKSRAAVEAELGRPQELGYKQWIYHRLTVTDATNPSTVSHSALISFTETEGGEVWHIGFAN